MNRLDSFNAMFGVKPVIGMIHLPPLPGSPLYDGEGIDKAIAYAVDEAKKLETGGVNGIEVENYNDASYYPGTVGPELVAAMAMIAGAVRKVTGLPLGVCILADPVASIAVAHIVKAQFIRATFFTEASVDVSGLVLGQPHRILRYRKFLDPSIKLFADVHIKHSAPLAGRPIEESAYDAAYFLADGVIISGKHTGKPTATSDLQVVKNLLPEVPVLVGSGLNAESAVEQLAYADGAVVGTSLKINRKPENPVDVDRVKALMKVVAGLRDGQVTPKE